jgi:hypothetical protein
MSTKAEAVAAVIMTAVLAALIVAGCLLAFWVGFFAVAGAEPITPPPTCSTGTPEQASALGGSSWRNGACIADTSAVQPDRASYDSALPSSSVFGLAASLPPAHKSNGETGCPQGYVIGFGTLTADSTGEGFAVGDGLFLMPRPETPAEVRLRGMLNTPVEVVVRVAK